MSTWARGALLAGVLLPFGMAGSASAANGTVRLHGIHQGHVLWLRAAPNPSAKKVGFIPAWGRNIRSLGCDQSGTAGWCRVHYRGTTGWAPGRFLRNGAPRLAFS